MYITVHVSLLSGRTVSLETTPEGFADVQSRAEQALEMRGRLIDSDGGALSKRIKLRHNQSLTLSHSSTQCQGRACIAAILGDGSVETWGMADKGGDCSSVRDQLKNVKKFQVLENAFAAILDDGSVVSWGG